MDKKNLKNIIQDYLSTSSFYAKMFYQNYKSRLSYEWTDYHIDIHWIWIHVTDKNNTVDIDFDYFRYDWIDIKYFDPWKLNIYSKFKYNYEFSKEIINEMELNWYIKKYHKSIYYYLI